MNPMTLNLALWKPITLNCSACLFYRKPGGKKTKTHDPKTYDPEKAIVPCTFFYDGDRKDGDRKKGSSAENPKHLLYAIPKHQIGLMAIR